MKQAGIYVNDVFCGVLTEDEEGFHFSYDGTYLTLKDAMPVSPTMPLTETQYDREMMFPVFDGNGDEFYCWRQKEWFQP